MYLLYFVADIYTHELNEIAAATEGMLAGIARNCNIMFEEIS